MSGKQSPSSALMTDAMLEVGTRVQDSEAGSVSLVLSERDVNASFCLHRSPSILAERKAASKHARTPKLLLPSLPETNGESIHKFMFPSNPQNELMTPRMKSPTTTKQDHVLSVAAYVHDGKPDASLEGVTAVDHRCSYAVQEDINDARQDDEGNYGHDSDEDADMEEGNLEEAFTLNNLTLGLPEDASIVNGGTHTSQEGILLLKRLQEAEEQASMLKEENEVLKKKNSELESDLRGHKKSADRSPILSLEAQLRSDKVHLYDLEEANALLKLDLERAKMRIDEADNKILRLQQEASTLKDEHQMKMAQLKDACDAAEEERRIAQAAIQKAAELSHAAKRQADHKLKHARRLLLTMASSTLAAARGSSSLHPVSESV